MSILSNFCNTEFTSYEDFYQNYQVTYPENFNFAFDVMDVLAAEQPDKRALVWCNDKGDERTFTFGELMKETSKTANFLRRMGIGKGDVVMTTLKRHYQYWLTILALHKIGAIIVPATHLLTTKDFVYRFDSAEVKAIITADDDEICGYIDEAAEKCKSLQVKIVAGGKRDGYLCFDEEIEKESENFERPTGDEGVTAKDTMLIYFTSGTTGMPKMVAHNFAYPLGHILTAKFWQNLLPTDLHLTVADTGWAKCSWGKIYGQWLCEAAVFVYDYDKKFKPVDLLAVIEKYGITTFCAPPTIFRFLIKEDVSQYDLHTLRASYTAGEPLNAEVTRQWEILTGIRLREGFGQTETSVLIATFPWLEPKGGSTGCPSPVYNIKIVDSEGKICEVGEEGEICIDLSYGMIPGLFTGYYKDPERTKTVMYDGFYHTGDMAWRDEDGYIWFVGRSDDVIKSSGYRIGPFEVESALLEHPAVLETAITAVPDPTRGQIVKATVVLAKGYTPSEELKKDLQNHVKNTTAPYKYPRIVEFVEELPKTISGKIRRVEIRNQDSSK